MYFCRKQFAFAQISSSILSRWINLNNYGQYEFYFLNKIVVGYFTNGTLLKQASDTMFIHFFSWCLDIYNCFNKKLKQLMLKMSKMGWTSLFSITVLLQLYSNKSLTENYFNLLEKKLSFLLKKDKLFSLFVLIY